MKRSNIQSSRDKRSDDLQSCHPFAGFLAGTGFWISHLVVAVGAAAVLLLVLLDLQIDGVWKLVAAAATIVAGYAVLFAFAGCIARSSH